jgi:2-methylcitrate dehydratase
MALKGEMGYPQALSAKNWGVNDVLLRGNPLVLQRALGSYVMENILFKLAYPAEFHAQTALECAVKLHSQVQGHIDDIKKITIETHESAKRIIDKTGPLNNPADRDHCLQYIVAVGLLKGGLTSDDYEEVASQDPRIDVLRNKMVVVENKEYSTDYLDPTKRSIANAITITWKDGSSLTRTEVQYPLGHHRRRQEGIEYLFSKLSNNLATKYSSDRVQQLIFLFQNPQELLPMPVSTLIDLFTI